MKKNYLIISLILITAVITAGCTKKTSTNQEHPSGNQETVQQNRNDHQAFPSDRFDQASREDLSTGIRISVTGEEGQDGIIIADRIIIGEFSGEGDGFYAPPQINGEETDTSRPRRDSSRFGGGDFNFEQFPNMTEEERQQFREERFGDGGGAGGDHGGFAERGPSAARVTGEIISIDDISITLQLDESGSKLIFYSDQTEIVKIKLDVEAQ